MKIAMLISQFPPSVGGTERQAFLVSRELARSGIDVQVITQRYQRNLARQERVEGIEIQRLGFPGTTRLASLFFLIRGFFYLAFKRPRPDVLHAHMIAAPALLTWIAGICFNRKTIVKVACSGPYGDVLTSRETWYGKLKLWSVLKWTDCFVCLTNEMEQEVLKAGAKAAKLVRIPNGVDTQRFRPVVSEEEHIKLRSTLGLPAGRWIVFAGRLTPQKRPGVLLDAFIRCKAMLPDANLLFLGDGPEKNRLEKKIQAENLSSRVLVRGNQSEMDAFYRSADLFVLPSAAEGLSNSLLEAMACGLPCITSDQGRGELIQNDRTGLVVPLDQPESLSRAIQDLLQNPTRAQALGSAARKKIEEEYRIETVAQKYAALYRELVGSTA